MFEESSGEHADRFTDEIGKALANHRVDLDQALESLGHEAGRLSEFSHRILATLRSRGKVMFAGNGGSAAEAQHFSAELVGRFRRERKPYAGLALSTDTSILTAIGNDYSYDEIFSRQILGLGRPGDLFVAFSTTGQSRNLVLAAEAARERTIAVVAVTGPQESALAKAADLAVRVPGADTATVQELHTVLVHVVCEIVERELSAP